MNFWVLDLLVKNTTPLSEGGAKHGVQGVERGAGSRPRRPGGGVKAVSAKPGQGRGGLKVECTASSAELGQDSGSPKVICEESSAEPGQSRCGLTVECKESSAKLGHVSGGVEAELIEPSAEPGQDSRCIKKWSANSRARSWVKAAAA